MDKQHERIVQRLVNNLIKNGCPSSQISISASQNTGLKTWANHKGIVFSKSQKVDILHPKQYSMESKPRNNRGRFIKVSETSTTTRDTDSPRN